MGNGWSVLLKQRKCLLPSAMTCDTLTNKSLQVKKVKNNSEAGKLQIQTQSLKVNNMPHSIYTQARQSMRCMPAVLRKLHHYISEWQAVGSACDLPFYITVLPFSFRLSSGSVPTPPPLHVAALHICNTVLWISLPALPPQKFRLTHKGCQVELAGLHVAQRD